jgi:hypothetical protein
MKTNELKKGDKIILRNGWRGIIEDNKKGNTRLATVFGTNIEIGSVYSHNIMFVEKEEEIIEIEHTKQQKNYRERLKRMGW